jgi:maleylacetoacetate isomerase
MKRATGVWAGAGYHDHAACVLSPATRRRSSLEEHRAMSIPKPIFYGNWRSSSSQRVRIGLNLKGIEVDYHPIDLSRSEQSSDAFRRVHPGAQVPVLLIDGLTLSQSVPILEYLDERFADRGVRLLPGTIEHRFAAREIAAFVSSFMQPLQLPGVTRRRMIEVFGLESHALGAEVACRRFAKAHLEATLPELDRLVSRHAGTFCIGAAPSLADCVVFPQLIGAASFGLDIKACATLARVYEQCMTLPAFADSLPERQVDAPAR